MTRILALDWDRQETRCLLADAGKRGIRVLGAAAAPIVDVAEEVGGAHPDVSGSLRAAVAECRAGRAVTIVGVDRASVELLNLTLPPAKDSELAELVAHQALRESQLAGEDATLDFVAMTDDPSEPRQVTAAMLSRAHRERIEGSCSAAGLKPQRIVLRPFAAASLFEQTVSPPERICLLVNLVADEADLAVWTEGNVVFLRTVRLPRGAGEDVTAQRLAAEIQRTLLVAQQGPLGGSAVEAVFVFGGPGEHEPLLEQLHLGLSLPVTVLDPFATVDVPAREMPTNPGRFAALLGMVLDETRGAHAVDFLHPRRPPRRPNRRRQLVTVAAALAIAAAAALYVRHDKLSTLDAENAELKAQVEELNDLVDRTRDKRDLIAAVRDWQDGEIVWLDELRDLSRRLPSSRDLLVQRMSMSPGRGGGGSIDLQGLVRDSSVVPRLEQSVRDDYHQDVRSNRVVIRDPRQHYAWLFEASMFVFPREKDSYAGHQAANP